jgi:ABC-2 type transport system ATP-binding protein
MDEAQRCHELVYIAYGKILARGSEKVIVEDSGLTVYCIEGEELGALTLNLRRDPRVMSVASFGNSIHVSGKRTHELESVIEPLRESSMLKIEKIPANLEDVFIGLLANVKDNYKD